MFITFYQRFIRFYQYDMIAWNILQSLLRAKISKYLLNYKITESKWKQFSLICSSNLTSFYHFYFLYTKLNIRFKQLWKLCISFRDRVDLINLQGLSFWFYLSNSVVVSTRPFLFLFLSPYFTYIKYLAFRALRANVLVQLWIVA